LPPWQAKDRSRRRTHQRTPGSDGQRDPQLGKTHAQNLLFWHINLVARLRRRKIWKKLCTSISPKEDEEILRASLSDLQSMVFSLEHGVGRGRPVNSPKAIAAAQPWLDVVLPDATQELSNIIQEKYSDLIESELRLLVPGIIDVSLKPTPDFITYNDGEKDIKIVIDKSFF
jgi:hypothetical protein